MLKKRQQEPASLDRAGKGAGAWVFAYLFAKKERANIDDDELADFRNLAQAYDRLTDDELAPALRQGALLEPCDEE